MMEIKNCQHQLGIKICNHWKQFGMGVKLKIQKLTAPKNIIISCLAILIVFIVIKSYQGKLVLKYPVDKSEQRQAPAHTTDGNI